MLRFQSVAPTVAPSDPATDRQAEDAVDDILLQAYEAYIASTQEPGSSQAHACGDRARSKEEQVLDAVRAAILQAYVCPHPLLPDRFLVFHPGNGDVQPEITRLSNLRL